MSNIAEFKHPTTGEIRKVKVGWSWILFLFSGFFGLPLFLRKLYIWGGVFLALWTVNLIGPELMPNQDAAIGLSLIMLLLFLGLQIWMGVKGNEMTGKNYLEQGWEWQSPESEATRYAKGKWGLVS